MPLVFGAAAVAAVVGFGLGIAALRQARRQDGYGRDLAAWAVALSIAAVPICVAGFFFTRYVVHEIDRYDDPGRVHPDPRRLLRSPTASPCSRGRSPTTRTTPAPTS